MPVSHKVASALLIAFACGLSAGPLLAQTVVMPRATVQHVRVLPGSNIVEVEITLSEPVAPRTQIVAAPDRLVVDFPQAAPGPQLRGLPVNRGDVKAVRVGLFESSPPTTRVVLDLAKTTGFQIFPSGRTVIVKLGGPAAVVSTSAANGAPGNPSGSSDPNTPPDPPPARVAVGYQNGLLSISAERATLAQVLAEIRSQTGAEVLVPPGAEQEKVFADFGPAPAKEVMSALLNGSPYNFILIGSAGNPNHLERVLLSRKGSSIVLDVGTPAPQAQPVPVAEANPPTYVNPPNRGARRGAPAPQGAADSAEGEADSDEPEPAEPQPQAVPQANPQAGDPQPQQN
jgi:hypothetical protein